jgi:hypothetical protein
MDVVTASFLVLGAVGAGGVVLHYAGYIPRPYRDRLERTQLALTQSLDVLPPRIGAEVEAALNRVASAQEAKYGEQLKAEAAAVQGQVKSAEMSMVRAVGVDRASRARVDHALSEAILGPALPILRQFAPGLADQLEENPALVDIVLQHPLFLKYVAPRIEQFLGKSGSGDVVSSGWGT